MVVYSGHWDHFGKRADGIYHGARDNALSVAALLELAKAFASIPQVCVVCGACGGVCVSVSLFSLLTDWNAWSHRSSEGAQFCSWHPQPRSKAFWYVHTPGFELL